MPEKRARQSHEAYVSPVVAGLLLKLADGGLPGPLADYFGLDMTELLLRHELISIRTGKVARGRINLRRAKRTRFFESTSAESSIHFSCRRVSISKEGIISEDQWRRDLEAIAGLATEETPPEPPAPTITPDEPSSFNKKQVVAPPANHLTEKEVDRTLPKWAVLKSIMMDLLHLGTEQADRMLRDPELCRRYIKYHWPTILMVVRLEEISDEREKLRSEAHELHELLKQQLTHPCEKPDS